MDAKDVKIGIKVVPISKNAGSSWDVWFRNRAHDFKEKGFTTIDKIYPCYVVCEYEHFLPSDLIAANIEVGDTVRLECACHNGQERVVTGLDSDNDPVFVDGMAARKADVTLVRKAKPEAKKEDKPVSILDGMTREEALSRVKKDSVVSDQYYFVGNDAIYNYPKNLFTGSDKNDSLLGWNNAINSHFDALEAAKKPKWVKPQMVGCVVEFCDQHTPELMPGRWSNDESSPEIARTNARRLLEEFARLNGGSGQYEIDYDTNFGKFVINSFGVFDAVGAVTFANREAAQEAIRRYPDELRLLAGVES